MKKFYKMMVFAMVFAVAMTTALVSPLSFRAADAIVLAETAVSNVIGATITIKAMPKNGVVGQALQLPVGSTASDAVIEAKVTDSTGRVITSHSTAADAAETFEFTPEVAGNYSVVYTATKAGVATTTSEKFTIKVVQSTAEMEFANDKSENTAFILPKKVGKTDSVVLPLPSIKEGETEVTDFAGLTVTVTNPKGVAMGELDKVKIDGVDHYVFKADKDANENELTGDYTVKYKYNANGFTAEKSYTITVINDYNAPTNLSYTLSGTFPTSAVLGNKLTLPTPKVVDKDNNNASVDVYTVVEVKFAGQAVEVDQNELSFIPNQKATGTDKYTVTYKIYDMAALNLATKNNKTLNEVIAEATPVLTGEYTLTDVEDTEKPEVKVVEDYNVAVENEVKSVSDQDAEKFENNNYEFLMPSSVRVNYIGVTLPAVYGYDNYSEYNGLKLTRTIKYNGNQYVLENEVQENDYVTYTQTAANETASVTFKKTGSYEIVYRAEDEAGNKSKALTYKLTVEEETKNDDVAPYITLPTDISKSAQVGDKIAFSAPTVVDYELDHVANPTSFATVDANPKTEVYAYVGTWTAAMNDTQLATATKLELVDGKYEYEIPAGAEAVSIVVRAEDHAKYLGAANNVAFASKTIKIYSADDTVVPVFADDDQLVDMQDYLNNKGAEGQGAVFVLPTVEFLDNGSYSTSFMVVDAEGTRLPVGKTQGKYTFTAVSNGTYSATIMATDRGGNSVFATVNFEVADTILPYLVVDSEINSGITMKIGSDYEIAVPKLLKNGKELDVEGVTANEYAASTDAVVMVDFDSYDQPGDYYFDEITWKFTPKAVGTYKFSYTAKNGLNLAENNETVYQIVVEKSSEEPVISLDKAREIPTYAVYDETAVIKLPTFNVESDNGINSTEIKVTGPKGNNVTVDAYDNTDTKIDEADLVTKVAYYGFKATDGVGLYTVNYKAVDKEGLSATKTSTIKIGDTLAPTAEGYTNPEAKTWTVGDELSINLKDITITDYNDVDEDATTVKGNVAISNTTGVKLTATLTGPNGTVSTSSEDDGIYVYALDKAGDYTLKYLAKDAAGNETEKVYNFTVKAKENNATSTEQTWGIILIVLSVVILGGVIIYFVKTKDADATNLPTKKDNK